jgi:hypothetical protein
MPDIDIDFADRNAALQHIIHIPASRVSGLEIKKHNTGVYCQDIPYDPVSGLASVDYRLAERLGYFKMDFLNLSVYQGVKDNAHLGRLMQAEPVWEMLEDERVVNLLLHLEGNYNIVRKIQPKSLEELAIVVAIKLPTKRHLIDQPMFRIRNEIWLPNENGDFQLKKSHSFAYAQVIMVHMNLLLEESTTA